ncbi:DUF7507 domain-containing protein [Streptomyces albipurpureus]|uniref:DUF11 domain-containing protein n=1 Tax=Streptomyces albipurpureus TaxID=2897419 RepID=A0ABT0UQQ9_9ACTN|nr:DUF11 domain-containing protein [Streptomyces sp. CWNU-1]MCM2389723.1 DUF11 domain-containing protein [Streptomyces sp. CWNU-1]
MNGAHVDMRGSPGRRRRLGALASTALVLASQAIALGAAVPVAHATTPGTPGLPQAPTVVYAEDFENGTGQTPILLPAYTGAPPVNATYTAAAPWLSAANCNGIILNRSGANQPACQAQSAFAMSELKNMANVLGQVAASPTPNNNHAVAAYTEGANPGANLVEFQTVNPIPLTSANRFITFSVDVAAVNCNVSAPLLNFFLTGGGPDIPLSNSPINPCTDARAQTYMVGPRPIRAGSFPADNSVLFTGAAAGIKMTNANGSGLGNDHAFDNIRILDVTPQLDKEFSPASIPQGGTSTLTFTVTNTTDLAEKDGFGFTDTLPAGVTVAAAPNASTTCGSGTVSAVAGTGTVGLTSGSLTSGTAFCTVTVDVTSSALGDHVNQPADLVPNGVNPPGPATLTVVAVGSPTIVKTADASTFATGQTINYTYTVTNTATTPLTNLTVTDSGPGAPTVTCAQTTLAAGASTTCTASYTATAADAVTGTITNSAVVNGTVSGQTVTATSNQVVIPLRSLTVTKDADQADFSAAGQTITYTFTVTNNGRVPLNNISVTDVGPGNPPVNCPAGQLAPGDSFDCTATYITTAADVTNGNVTDSATATGMAPDGEQADDSSNTVIVPFVPPAQVDLAAVKTGPATVGPGGTVTYTVTITNNGPGDSTGYTVTDAIPAGLSNASTSTPGCGIGSGTLTCTANSLAAGASTTITLTGTAAAGATSIVNTVTVTGENPDPDPDNNTSTFTTTVTQIEADLAMSKTGPASVSPGGTITYQLQVTNNGPDASTGYTVTDTLPAGLSNASTSTPGCSITGGVLTCDGGALAVGDSDTITVTGTAAAGATTITNTAKVTGDNDDPNPDNNTSTTTTNVTSVTITKKQNGPSKVRPGAEVPYTITVRNNGGAIVDASFTDDLSDLLDDAVYNDDATATVGSVTFSSPDLEWSGTLAPGETATITFSVTVKRRPFGDLRLDNTVVSTTPGNNCPAGSTDSRCTTHGTVDVKDKDKGKGKKAAQPQESRRDRTADRHQNPDELPTGPKADETAKAPQQSFEKKPNKEQPPVAESLGGPAERA